MFKVIDWSVGPGHYPRGARALLPLGSLRFRWALVLPFWHRLFSWPVGYLALGFEAFSAWQGTTALVGLLAKPPPSPYCLWLKTEELGQSAVYMPS
jgi:hypothetical protein